ncbi:MAG: hypothetical protein KDB53_00755 [Planctomycetes bacterium]|nr:hypothetical protein [Planctomycetota bacterium]
MDYRCTPASLFSRRYHIEGDGRSAVLDFQSFGRNGTIRVDEIDFRAEADGWFNPNWTLSRDDRDYVRARRPNMFTRRYELESSSARLVLRPESMWARSWILEQGNQCFARIRQEHMFTRRARIEVSDPNCDFLTLCFAFWMVARFWREQGAT